MYGNGGEEIDLSYNTRSFSGSYKMKWEGFVNNLERRYKNTSSDGVKYDIERYMRTVDCPACAVAFEARGACGHGGRQEHLRSVQYAHTRSQKVYCGAYAR